MNYMNQKNLETLDSLRARLLTNSQWPKKYMFKFIVPNNQLVLNDLLAVMPKGGQTCVKPSKGLHYVSVTHTNLMYSADDIIRFTVAATAIDGVVAL